ncbi:ABC transporter permease [Halorarum salinum]|uniref:ABC transporter permease n=1 Tax=Halorarum salinum TaxID=2743089 RepID=A0A7D5L865_9EURY|nr:ABC transporter permease [Halobaculum salinum]
MSRGRLINALSLIAGFILWEMASNALGTVILAPPTDVLTRLFELIVSLELIDAMIGSLTALSVGYVIAVTLGTPLGFALAQSKYVRWAVNPYIDAIYTTPVIAYLPLVVVWFGLDFRARVFFVFIFCFFEILISVFDGVKTVQNDYMSVAKSFDAPWLFAQRKVILPAALPFIFSGYRLGIGRAVRGIIVAELFLRIVNIGNLLQAAGATFDTSQQIAVVIAVALMGIGLQRIVLGGSQIIAPWYYEQSGREA